MSKAIEFQSKIEELVTDYFTSKEELEDAIEFFKDTTIASILESQKVWYE